MAFQKSSRSRLDLPARFCLIITLIIQIIATSAWAHGPEANGEKNPCDFSIGDNHLHLGFYQVETSSDAFCSKLPGPGLTSVVIDIEDKQLWATAFALKIDYIDSENLETLLNLPPKSYSNGTLFYELDLNESGSYRGLLKPADPNSDEIIFEFTVDKPHSRRIKLFWIGLFGLALMSAYMGIQKRRRI